MVVATLIAAVFLVRSQVPCTPDSFLADFVPRAQPLQTCDDLAVTEQALCREGERLFVSPDLSPDRQVSCTTCHHLNPLQKISSLSDGRSRPQTRGKTLDLPRTPSLLDVGRSKGPFFWNGRAGSLATQPFWPLYGAEEIRATPKSLEEFGGAAHVARALAAYMKTFETSAARFDKWLQGDCTALSEEEFSGLQLMQQKGCLSCHQGSEFRGARRIAMHYAEVPAYARAKGEVSYSADAELALSSGRKNKHAVLQTVPPSLRNLKYKGPPFGRFGQSWDLSAYLRQHGKQPVDAKLRFSLTKENEAKIVRFLTVSLSSVE